MISTAIDAINVYTWGRNPNVTLGHDRTKKYPEKLDVTLAPTDFIVKASDHECAMYASCVCM